MSVLFSSIQLGNLQIKNRFVHSATYESMASKKGEVTNQLLNRYQILTKFGTGLLIPGFAYVHPFGRAYPYQLGVHTDDMIPGLKKLADVVHLLEGKIALQLVHAGRQTLKTLIGRRPMGPSRFDRDPMYMVKPAEMKEEEILETIEAFGKAALRVVEAGIDGIQLHAAHGYLINQFISPYYNRRTDRWGGSDNNRFRFLRELILSCRNYISNEIPILVKLSTNDFTPTEGITPPLAEKYAKWLNELGVSGLELSCGSAIYSFMNMCRGMVPVDDLVSGLPGWKKPIGKLLLKKMVGKFELEEGYNVAAARLIKPHMQGIPLAVVGGFRSKYYMEEIIDRGVADLVSMSRPFIREPDLLEKFRTDRADRASCISCNKCLAAIVIGKPVRCFQEAADNSLMD